MLSIIAFSLTLATLVSAGGFCDLTKLITGPCTRCSTTDVIGCKNVDVCEQGSDDPSTTSLTDELQTDPIKTLITHLRPAGEGVGPDLGGGLTLDPNLNAEEKKLLLALKVRLQGSGIVKSLFASGGRRLPQPADQNITAESLKQFFESELPSELYDQVDEHEAHLTRTDAKRFSKSKSSSKQRP